MATMSRFCLLLWFFCINLLSKLPASVDAFLSTKFQRSAFVAVVRPQKQRQQQFSTTSFRSKDDVDDDGAKDGGSSFEDHHPSSSSVVVEEITSPVLLSVYPKLLEKEITSPVLLSVYPKLLEYVKLYGHPNIPLGTPEGRNCETLRKLQIQDKLTTAEVDLLTQLGFRWHSLEDVYYTSHFDDLLQRLLLYAQENDGDLSPPKKYAPDPELGAWVTGLRRLGPDQVANDHVDKLNEIGFSWVSQRKCGSAFMKEYRNLVQRIQREEEKERNSNDDDDDDGEEKKTALQRVLQDAQVQKWIVAQKQAAKRNALSETRKHYLEQLLGADWMELEF